MPAINGSSLPITAEDMMATSALEVSPILTASIFDEIYTAVTEQDEQDDTSRLSIHQPLPPPSLQQRRRRHTPLGRLNTDNNNTFDLPPPSAQWTRRLNSMQQAEDGQELIDNHIGPITPVENGLFPQSNSSTFIYGQNCLNGRAYNTRPLLLQEQDAIVNMLDFEVVFDDGGQYGYIQVIFDIKSYLQISIGPCMGLKTCC